jgi:hypothetical protein
VSTERLEEVYEGWEKRKNPLAELFAAIQLAI